MKKKLKIILLSLLIAAIGIFFAKNVFAKIALSKAVNVITGLGLEIDSLNVGILKSVIEVKNIKIINPPGFIKRTMANVPEIYVDYDLGAFFQNKIHLKELKIDLSEFVVIKNEAGQVNIKSLKVVKEKETKEAVYGAKAPQTREIKIDVLKLKIGKVVYIDYSAGIPPPIKEFNINIDETYNNITDLPGLGRLILFRAVVNTAISDLINLDLERLQKEIPQMLMKKITGLITEATPNAEGAAKDLLKKAAEKLQKLLPEG